MRKDAIIVLESLGFVGRPLILVAAASTYLWMLHELPESLRGSAQDELIALRDAIAAYTECPQREVQDHFEIAACGIRERSIRMQAEARTAKRKKLK